MHNSLKKIIPQKQAPRRDPWQINSLRQLFAVFGVGLWVFLGLQFAAAIMVAKFFVKHFHIPFNVSASIQFVLFLTINGIVYAFLKGRRHHEFMPAALVTSLVTILPGFLLWLANRVDLIASTR